MPEITPVWIDGYYPTRADIPSAMCGDDAVLVPMQALTLDQIEAWLRGTPSDNRGYVSIDALLVQVQAWKENK